jgi:hypothetical protein
VILVDTPPLVALCDPRDALHDKALSDLDRLARRGLVLCEPVPTEACLLLSLAAYDREFRTTWRRPGGTRIATLGRCPST